MGTAPPEFWSPFEPALIEPHSTNYQGDQSDHVIDSFVFPEHHSYATVAAVTSSRSTTWDVAAGGTNWYANPGVETANVNDYSTGTGNTKAYSTLFARTGVGSAEITLGATADSNTIYGNSLSATGTGTFEPSTWVFIPSTAPAYTPRYYRMFLESGNGSVVSNPVTKAVVGKWTRISAVVNLTATGATTLVVRTAGSDGSSSVVSHDTTAKVYFDDFYIGPSLKTVTASRSTTWDVAGPTVPVSASRSTTWNVNTSTSATRSTTWDVKAAVAASRATTWDAKASVAGSRSTTWNVFTQAAASRATTWDVKAAVSGSRATTWVTLAGVAGSRSTTWDVAGNLTPVSASRSTTWDVASSLVSVSASRSTTWDVKAVVSGSRATTWDVKHIVPAVSRTNSSKNPSFETDLSFWTISGAGTTNARITSDGYVGSACTEVTKAAVVNSGTRTLSTQSPTVAPGEVWTASVYVKVPAGQENSSQRIFITWVQADLVTQTGTSIGTASTVTSADGWVRRTITGTAPALTAGLLVSVGSSVAETAGQKFLVDALLIEKSSTVGFYFDGSSNGTWTGTTNLSTSVTGGTGRSTTWNVLTSATSARSTTWDVKQSASASRLTTWDVASNAVPVSAARSTTWDVKAARAASRSTTWNVKAQIAASKATSWNTLRTAGPSARSTTWDTKAGATAARSTSWDVKAQVSASRWGIWDCRLAEWFFSPPALHYRNGRRLTGENHQWLPHDVGATLVRVNGVWSQVYNQRDDELAAADVIYKGGYTYPITKSTADELTAAGFGAGVTTT